MKKTICTSFVIFLTLAAALGCSPSASQPEIRVSTTYAPSKPVIEKVGSLNVVRGATHVQGLITKYDPAVQVLSLKGQIVVVPVVGGNSFALGLDLMALLAKAHPSMHFELEAGKNQTAPPSGVKVGAFVTCLGQNQSCDKFFIDIYVDFQGYEYHHQVGTADEPVDLNINKTSANTSDSHSDSESQSAQTAIDSVEVNDDLETSDGKSEATDNLGEVAPENKKSPSPSAQKLPTNEDAIPKPSVGFVSDVIATFTKILKIDSKGDQAGNEDTVEKDKPHANTKDETKVDQDNNKSGDVKTQNENVKAKGNGPSKENNKDSEALKKMDQGDISVKNADEEEEDEDDEGHLDPEYRGRYLGDVQGDLEKLFGKKNGDQSKADSKDKKNTILDQVVGEPSRGHLEKASNLLLEQKIPSNSGIHIIRPERERYYGSYELLTMVKSMGQFTKKILPKYSLPIGDLSKKTGGKIGKHASHQSGQDVDVAFYSKGSKSNDKLVSVLSHVKSGSPVESWMEAEQWGLFKFLVSTKFVDRIFIHPNLKKTICQMAVKNGEIRPNQSEGTVYEALRRLRPEVNHYNHFHLRVKCSKAQIRCRQMADPPEGTGCF
jgi:penicillin-insensitive murein endopeptidase